MNQNNNLSSTVILVTNNGMGRADIPLQHKLIVTYLSLLLEHSELPAAICLYTEGVRLAVEGSPVLTHLKALEQKGVRIILCITCLNYFNLADHVEVGIVGGMADILEAQWKAEKVISI
ncbi:MAG: hypothetical protein A2Z16_04385 [Chloroflexi bacterium RBG_16_54_18]|nr:MAG: hypothetical protein A2Z16_04385 [Chloroflexi bacterium RBG_16_54_18]